MEYIRFWVDLYKADLKSFNATVLPRTPRAVGAILDSIRRIHAIWSHSKR
jgi:hypothetical protein